MSGRRLLKQRARSGLSDISHDNYKQKMKAKKQANKQIHGLLFLFENGDFFSSVWPTVHTYPVKRGYQKRIFSKTLSSVEMSERLAVLVWMDKTKVLENNCVTELDTSKCACSHQRWYRLPLHVDGQNQFKNATCGRRVLEKRRKKSPSSNKPNTCGRGFRALA